MINYSNLSSISYRWEEPEVFKDSTSQIGRNRSTLIVPNPPTGSYQIKVIATDINKYMTPGQATVTLQINASPTTEPQVTAPLEATTATVHNSPPVAKIDPESGVTIVDTKIIFSATLSSDPDDKYEAAADGEAADNVDGVLVKSDIVSYSWEIKDDNWANWVEEGTIVVTDENVLELKPIKPGNLTLTLTATDTQGLTDTTEATLNIKDDIDDPPTANAGDAVEIYLPTDHATICGNSSTDDKGIVEWNWSPDASNPKQTGMNGVNRKCLTVSEIEIPGMYWFTLKVCDKKGQCDEAKAQV